MSSAYIFRFIIVFVGLQLLGAQGVFAGFQCHRTLMRVSSVLSHPVRALTHRRIDLKKTGSKVFHYQKRKKWALENHLDAHDASQMGKSQKNLLEAQIGSYAIAYRKELKAIQALQEVKNGKAAGPVAGEGNVFNGFHRKYQIFDSGRVKEIFGEEKTPENLTVDEVVKWLKANQELVLEDLESSSHYTVRPWIKRTVLLSSLIAVGALMTFGTSYTNSRAGGLSAAISERGYSNSRLPSYQAIYGKLVLDDPELAEEYRHYFEEGERYYAISGKSFSNWAQYGKWDAVDTSYGINDLITNIELGEKFLDSDDVIQEFRIRSLYQFLYSVPHYQGTTFDREIRAFEAAVHCLNRVDPDKEIRRRMLEDREAELDSKP